MKLYTTETFVQVVEIPIGARWWSSSLVWSSDLIRETTLSRTGSADSGISIGHMLNQHYLDPMFPLSKGQKQAEMEKRGIKWKSGMKSDGHNENNVGDKFDENFLNRIVSPDERLAMQRDFTAIAEMGIVRPESGLEFGSGQVFKDAYGLTGGKDAKEDECLTFKRTASDRIMAEEARGKTVKELSRLWKYLGGKSPTDHDHTEDGYHDENSHEHRKQGNTEQKLGNGSVLEQQKSPISPAFDRPKSPLPQPSPTTAEQFIHVSGFSEPFLRRARGNLS